MSRLSFISLFFAAILCTSNISQARNSFPSATATASIKVSIQKLASIQVNSIENDAFSFKELTVEDPELDLCIYASHKQYDLSLTSSNGSEGSYQLSDGNQLIDYRVLWSDGGEFVDVNDSHDVFANAATRPCDKKSNAKLRMDFQPELLASADKNRFSDTLTLMFEAQ